jgi:hypothetical protein
VPFASIVNAEVGLASGQPGNLIPWNIMMFATISRRSFASAEVLKAPLGDEPGVLQPKKMAKAIGKRARRFILTPARA